MGRRERRNGGIVRIGEANSGTVLEGEEPQLAKFAQGF